MNRACYAFLTIPILFISSCATPRHVTPMPTSGSKADGMVVLSYQKGLLDSVIVDSDGADSQAKESCKAWGYKDAKKFSGWQSQCQQYGHYGCMSEIIHINYQCI